MEAGSLGEELSSYEYDDSLALGFDLHFLPAKFFFRLSFSFSFLFAILL